jgi:hypothetical protein
VGYSVCGKAFEFSKGASHHDHLFLNIVVLTLVVKINAPALTETIPE